VRGGLLLHGRDDGHDAGGVPAGLLLPGRRVRPDDLPPRQLLRGEQQRAHAMHVRRLPQRRGRDDIDEIFADDSPSAASGKRPTALRSVEPRSESRVHLVQPHSFNDAQEIGDCFRDGVPVIINLVGADPDLVRRLIDFASGLTYALDGSLQKIAEKVFVLTPQNVEFSAEERAAMVEKGFFNQS
jgi:cell division inhibitor SepF